MKHLPGYGRAAVDPHISLPVTKVSREQLELDLAPFKAHADAPMGMTAHLIVECVDDVLFLTVSE